MYSTSEQVDSGDADLHPNIVSGSSITGWVKWGMGESGESLVDSKDSGDVGLLTEKADNDESMSQSDNTDSGEVDLKCM